MKKTYIILILLLFSIVSILSFVKISKNKEMKAKTAPMMKGGPPTLVASAYVVEYSKLANEIKVNGNVLAQDEVVLQPEASGRVTYLNLKEGALVSKGTLLLKINDADLQAQVSKLKTQQKIAQSNFERLKTLLAIKGVSQAEYDAAENNLNNIIADLNLLQVQINKTELRAPFSGKLGLRNISLGAYVSPNTQIVTLQNTSQLKVDVFLPEKYSNHIQIGDFLQCQTASSNDVFKAKVIAFEPFISQNTRNLKVRAIILNNTSKIFPGAYIKAKISLKEIPNTIMIPSNAIIPDDKITKIIITDSGRVKFINIEVGFRTEHEVQVLSGLKIGDTVLTSGLLHAKPGMAVKIKESTSKSIVK
jgi:membrane fusion protein (multidrug efflux system)